jgi:dTDP-4-dehydrorhamnose reductase
MKPLDKILITGCGGQVGFELTRSLALLGDVVAIGLADVDLANAQAIVAKLNDVKPTIIVNPAAYTAVDKAESDSATAYAINATAPEVMAQWAAQNGALLIQYSTDYVFDGTKDGIYTEQDTPNPMSVYGASKWQGEQLVAANCAAHVILRTSWVFGAHGANFLKTILRLAGERDTLNIVNDQIGAPTSAAMLADVTAHVIMRIRMSADADKAALYGTYHLTADGATSWHGYAQYVLGLGEQAGMTFKTSAAKIGGIPTTAYPTPAVRPLNSRISCDKLKRTFGLSLPTWQTSAAQVFTMVAGK